MMTAIFKTHSLVYNEHGEAQFKKRGSFRMPGKRATIFRDPDPPKIARAKALCARRYAPVCRGDTVGGKKSEWVVGCAPGGGYRFVSRDELYALALKIDPNFK